MTYILNIKLINRLALIILIAGYLLGCSTPKTQPVSDIETEPELSKTEFLTKDGYRLPLTQFWPKKTANGITIALHGFNDYSKAFEGMCHYFVEREMACIAYDQRGFGGTELLGLWPQKGRLQQDLFALVKAVRKQYPQQPIFLVGESMGGAVIMTAMADVRFSLAEQVNGVGLYAPAVWARSTQPWYQKLSLWFAVHTFPGWMPTGEGLGVQATDNIDALRAMGQDDKVIKATRIDTIYGLTNLMDEALLASKDVNVRTLILYGEKDEVIPKNPTCEMLMVMKSNEESISFITYSDGYHMLSRDLQAERVFQDSLDWMQDSTTNNEYFSSRELKQSKSIDYCEKY